METTLLILILIGVIILVCKRPCEITINDPNQELIDEIYDKVISINEQVQDII